MSSIHRIERHYHSVEDVLCLTGSVAFHCERGRLVEGSIVSVLHWVNFELARVQICKYTCIPLYSIRSDFKSLPSENNMATMQTYKHTYIHMRVFCGCNHASVLARSRSSYQHKKHSSFAEQHLLLRQSLNFYLYAIICNVSNVYYRLNGTKENEPF